MKAKTESTEINKKENIALAATLPAKGIGIQGLEDYDATILPVPFVRIVQAMSKEVKMANGEDAPEGKFFFNDTKEAKEELRFVLLKSKPVIVDFEREGKKKPTPLRKLLGMLVDTKKVFVLTIGVSSFSNFGRLVALMKEAGMKATWERVISVKTYKEENEKGKFHVAQFALEELLQEEEKIEMGMSYEEWKRVLDNRDNEEEITHKLPFE